MNDPFFERSEWGDEKDIPKRPWIVPGYLLRGCVTIVGGPGGAGKSSLMIGWCASLALGRQFNHFCPPASRKVLFYNVEDDLDEQQRRLSAALRQFSCVTRDLSRNLLALCPREIGTLLDFESNRCTWQPTAAMQRLEEHICLFCPDVLILDPLVELHNTEENAQTAMRAVVAYFRALAQRYNMAVVILHHTRKDSAEGAGNPDIVRGASATIAAARIAFTALPMSEKEAENLQIQNGMRRSCFRVDPAKTNYAPAHAAEWFQLAEYTLDNTELVAAAIPWQPPDDHSLDTSEQDRLHEIVAKGINGEPYSPELGRRDRSVSFAFEEAGIRTRKGQQDMLSKLLRNGFAKARFRAKGRHQRWGLMTLDGRPNVDWISEDETKH